MVILLGACATWQPPAPDRPVKTVDLLIDSSVMPAGWVMVDKHELTRGVDDLSVGDSAVAAFVVEEELQQRPTKQYIHRYRNSAAAQGVYDDLIHVVGVAPSTWTYHSTVADESAFACYDYEGREPYPICEWAARYEEYVVTVTTWLVPDHMSLQSLEKVIQAVDSQMAQQLGKP